MVESEVCDEVTASSMAGELREKVHVLKKAGYNVSNMTDLLTTPVNSTDIIRPQTFDMPAMTSGLTGKNFEVSEDVSFLLSNWKAEQNYTITSHRKITGPVLVYGRKLVYGELTRSIGPIIDWQNHLNYLVANVLARHDINDMLLNTRMDQLEGECRTSVDKYLKELCLDPATFNRRISDLETQVTREQRSLHNKLDYLNSRLEAIVSNHHKQQDGAPDLNYNQFTDLYGGSEDNIREIYSGFIGCYAGCQNVLDIGCGRGYFLDMAAERSIGAYGVDVSDHAVEICKSKNLEAINADALEHLMSIADKSLDGVFISHVVEHLHHKELVLLIKLISEKLRPGSIVTILMPNITNVSVSSVSFYMDPTHVTHLHPDYLSFLLRSYKFNVIKTTFYQPTIPEDVCLQKIDVSVIEDPNTKETIDRINMNIEKLNNLLFGNRDCAIVAQYMG